MQKHLTLFMLALCATLALVRCGDDVIPVNQCFNTMLHQGFYFWCVQNCGTASVTPTIKLYAANGSVIESPTYTFPVGWSCAGSTPTGISVYYSVASKFPGPYTLTITSPSGKVHSTQWDGCTSVSSPCSPASPATPLPDSCYSSKYFTSPATCP